MIQTCNFLIQIPRAIFGKFIIIGYLCTRYSTLFLANLRAFSSLCGGGNDDLYPYGTKLYVISSIANLYWKEG